MKIVLRNAKIVHKGHALHGQRKDILIENGLIKDLDFKGTLAPKTTEVISKNLHVSAGWLDLKAHLGQPGFEERETLESGSKAASAGGFTRVAVLPTNQPITENKSTVEFIKKFGTNQLVELLPYGAITKGCNGSDLADLYDMHNAGAVGFTDDIHHIQNPKLLQLALEYTQGFNGLVISSPLEYHVAGKGNVNEGETSTRLGLKGIPHFAEEIQVSRDLKILEYTGGRLHFSGISSAESFAQIAKAKKKGLNVTCEIAAHLLVLNDLVLEEFDSNYKVMPPIRTEKDRREIVKAVNAGIIDAVVSDHRPQNIENKDCEFETAHYGMIGLQTVFSHLIDVIKDVDLIVEKLTSGPFKVLGMPINDIKVGAKANLTIFDPDTKWNFDKKQVLSISHNTPFMNKILIGKALGIVNGKNLHLNS
ncbi:MAG: dihydroorotase [Flavobacteriales bacterium]|nr:dihydroorotase [Flavobacteriales bacterium]